jgi:hypothetical protein
MRQLSPVTNLLLACLSALGLVAALGLPWYAPAQPEADPSAGLSDGPGPMEQFANQLARTFTNGADTITGSDAVGTSRELLLIVAAAVIALSVAMLVPTLRSVLRDVLRAVALVAPIATIYLAFDTPGETASLEIRWGLVVGVLVSAFMASAAWHGAGIRVRRPGAPPAARSRAAA